MVLKKFVYFMLILGVSLFSVNLFAEVKIGVFDLQKVMVKSQAGKDIKKLLEQKRDFYSKEIKKREQKLKQMRQDLEKKAMMLSEQAKQEKEKEYQKKLRDLKLYASDSENELKNLYREKTQKLIHDILQIARDYGKKKNFTFIIEKQEGGIVYVSNTVDITDEILKEFDNFYKKNKK